MFLSSWLHGPPNRFYPLIGNDVSAAEKADSFTFAGALVDGCHAMPQSFVDVVQERCASVEGSASSSASPTRRGRSTGTS